MRLRYVVLAFAIMVPSLSLAQTPAPSDATFGFELLRQLASDRAKGNVIIAPRNIRTALAAVASGATGDTRH